MKHFESRYFDNWQELGPIWWTGPGTGLKFGTGLDFWTARPVRTGPSAISGNKQETQDLGRGSAWLLLSPSQFPPWHPVTQ